MPSTLLRQSAHTVVSYTATQGNVDAPVNLPQGLLGTAGSRLLSLQCIYGSAHGFNYTYLGTPTTGIAFPAANDVGWDDGTNAFSTDETYYDEAGTDAGKTLITFRCTTQTGVAGQMAAWIGEFIDIDQTLYNGGTLSRDRSYANTGVTSSIAQVNPGGNTANFTPEAFITVAGVHGLANFLTPTYPQIAVVTDNANISMAIQVGYVNAIADYAPIGWTLDKSIYNNTFFLGLKTTVMPKALGRARRISLGGFGVPGAGVHLGGRR